mmetsp:Transcript_20255/g.43702  ORF Transcript_20255/g.43702 Transcript_20255/m.43702 type:complete len:348 (+) Transcript_20255:101-1144(+)|eukprot:CAMPEP_0178521214 /NCGR_PEP_ID=MMETSP0696-20121128/27825_1 /TAXON_ID=265572 /ORGANISM="Extubocellulus spinifer, Strain CCMP396" /LENGTH=347 /DNA_ID=CAMNT_0020152137 /DNA_START=34 /DNA_END=1077 /DNA_ORIENTATION=+
MKLSTALILAASAGAASAASRKAIDVSASHKVSGAAARKLIRASRRLEDEEQDNQDEEEDEFSYLMNYSMKFVQCVPDYQVYGEDGEPESSSVIYRLCPNDAESESAFGCTDEEAFGDYVVGINSYTNAIAEAMQQEAEQNGNNNNDNGEEFNLQEYAECREADMNMEDEDEDEGRRRLEGNQQFYYIGPKCIDIMDSKGKKVVGSDIGLGFFTDQYCSQESEITYYELTGSDIPYSTGGLGGQYKACSAVNDDGEYEVSEMCQGMAENVALRCDQVYQNGCEAIEELEADLKAREAGSSSAGKVFLVILILLLLGGGVFWFLKKKKEKAAANGEEPSTGGFFSQLC